MPPDGVIFQPLAVRPPLGIRMRVAVIVLLALHFGLAVGSKRDESTASDELAHLTAGFTYWRYDDYRLHAENGNLPQRWAALPAAIAGARYPELAANEYWSASDVWVLGHQFFYETGEDHFPRLMAGRAMIALFSVATGLLVFAWSRRLFGTAGGLISLVFFTFSPVFLAHGALVTSDCCMTFFFLAAVGAWWWHLHDSRPWVAGVSCLIFGLAQVAKFSGVLLLPMMVILAGLRVAAPSPVVFGRRQFDTWWRKSGAIALSAAAHAVAAIAIIWIFYGFRFAALNPALPGGHLIVPWAIMVQWSGFLGTLADLAAAIRLLPESYLYGFIYVVETTKVRSAFLNGNYSDTGWLMFFPWAFLLKTTTALLAGLALGTGIALRRWLAAPWARVRGDLYRIAPLITLFSVYWIFSLTSHLNIGHRHLLVIYPVLFIAVGVLGPWGKLHRWAAVIVIAVAGGQAFTAARTWPHYLAYFNALAGGPANGWRHLVDSSLDWGQDLPGLKKWLDQHAGHDPVYLSYFGTGEPVYYSIDARRLPFVNGFKFPEFYVPLEAGIYCVSATMLQQVYSPVRGPWTLELEKEYQGLRAMEPAFARFTHDPAMRTELAQTGSTARFEQTVSRHNLLRFARLCHYLRVRPRDADIGHSIFIYRLSAGEIKQATAGPLSEWSALIEKTVTHP